MRMNIAPSSIMWYNKFVHKIPNERGAMDEHTIKYVISPLL